MKDLSYYESCEREHHGQKLKNKTIFFNISSQCLRKMNLRISKDFQQCSVLNYVKDNLRVSLSKSVPRN